MNDQAITPQVRSAFASLAGGFMATSRPRPPMSPAVPAGPSGQPAATAANHSGGGGHRRLSAARS